MKNGLDFGNLLRKTSAALFLCAITVFVCYLFVDRPVAFYMHRLAAPPVLKWLTYLPDILLACVPVVLAALIIMRVRRPFRRWERVVLAACLGLVLAAQFKEALAYVFGRYWPETWINNNPSLIKDGAYGFHPFHAGISFRSFPSGHTARTLAVDPLFG